MSPVWLVGAQGRTPFVGHFRGARVFGGARLAWAGRVAGTAGVVEGWDAAEAARSALAELSGAGSPQALLAAACGALGRIDAREAPPGPTSLVNAPASGVRWLARGDMSVLLVATEAGRAWAAGSGLAGVWAAVPGGWRALDVPAVVAEPGVPADVCFEVPTADRWVAVPAGGTFPKGDVAAACGAHR